MTLFHRGRPNNDATSLHTTSAESSMRKRGLAFYESAMPRLAGKHHLERLASQIRLANVLAGDTCAPIGLAEFEAYLAYREYSLQNLQFIVWFQDYRDRFFSLPTEIQARSPGSATFEFESPTTATVQRRRETAKRLFSAFSERRRQNGLAALARSNGEPVPTTTGKAAKARMKLTKLDTRSGAHSIKSGQNQDQDGGEGDLVLPTTNPNPFSPALPTPTSLSTVSPFNSKFAQPALAPVTPSQTRLTTPHSAIFDLSPTSPSFLIPKSATNGNGNGDGGSEGHEVDPSNQPFRDECMRILTTFLRPGAPKELNLNHDVRDTVLRSLAWNTHPDVFLPAYEATFYLVESSSLPVFIKIQAENINLSKQIYWYLSGIVWCLAWLAIELSLIFCVKTPPEPKRAYRLIGVPIGAYGITQIYSAWRGYCSQVWKRGATQLKSWELEEPDGSGLFHTITRSSTSTSSASEHESGPESIVSGGRKKKDDEESIHSEGKGSISMSPRTTNMPIAGIGVPSSAMERSLIAPWDEDYDVEEEDKAQFGATSRRSSYSMTVASPSSTTAFVPQPLISPLTSPITQDLPHHYPLSPLSPPLTPGSPRSYSHPNNSNSGQSRTTTFSTTPMIPPNNRSTIRQRVTSTFSSRGRDRYRRPPVFGPETAVLDPRIKAYHVEVYNQIVRLGLWWILGSSIVLLLLPSLKGW